MLLDRRVLFRFNGLQQIADEVLAHCITLGPQGGFVSRLRLVSKLPHACGSSQFPRVYSVHRPLRGILIPDSRPAAQLGAALPVNLPPPVESTCGVLLPPGSTLRPALCW